MDKQDKVSGWVWLITGLLIVIGSISLLDVGTFYNPGPGLFPLMTGALLGFLSFMILIRATLNKATEKGNLRELWAGLKWQKMLYTIGALFIYSLIIDRIGFLLTTFLLLIFLFRAIEPQRWRVVIGSSVLISIVFYLVFDRLLQVQLPRGFWGF